ncbi:MAG TPA: glycosyltransferase family 87 protein, partial [Solirubrobacteraceae bacterium]
MVSRLFTCRLAPTLAALFLGLWAPAASAAPSTSRTPPTGRSNGPGSTSLHRLSSASATTNSETPVPVVASDLPPAGRRLSANQVLAIADRLSKMRAVRREYPGSYGGAYLKGPLRWQVSYFSRGGKKEIGQVIIDDATGRVLEQWTGFQVAWTMARGYPGAFGRHVNALYIWIPLCLLFVAPFIRWRKPFSLLHLDLLVLLSFSVSLAFFNNADIYASVPLTYPPLVYLLIRMLAACGIAKRRSRTGAETDPQQTDDKPSAQSSPAPHSARLRLSPYRPPERSTLHGSIPMSWMAVGVVFLLGFRIGLNVTDSNVIDVGYAGVIGAQKIVKGGALYGHWPSDNEHGDTYGPVNYEVYVPFEQALGFTGHWDDLPAAHGAAIAFDLLAVLLLFLIGLQIRGPTLGVGLAYAWVAYPFTLFGLESNSNDTLVAVLVLAGILAASRPAIRGGFAALAGLAKFAPLAIAPLLFTHGVSELPVRRRARALASSLFAFVLVAGIVSIPALSGNSLHTIYERTVAYQANRGSPFSVWGLYGGLDGPQEAVQIAAVILILLLAFLPRRADVIGLAGACAAVMI